MNFNNISTKFLFLYKRQNFRKMVNPCRLCLSFVSNDNSYDSNIANDAEIKYILPEIDVSLTTNLFLCDLCLKSLNNAYVFKRECLRVEHCIQEYLKRHPDKIRPIDLNEIKSEHLEINRDERLDIKAEKRISFDKENYHLKTKSNLRSNIEHCGNINAIGYNVDSKNVNDVPVQKDERNVEESSSEILENHTILDKDFCETCKRTFKNAKALKRHISTHIKDKSKASGLSPDKERIHVCDICNSSFFTSSTLKRHKSIHSSERSYACNLCDKSYKVKAYLQQHIAASHAGVKRHACEVCGMKFTAKTLLLNHIRTHTGERPYKCEYCAKGFAQECNLIVHIKCNHRDEKPFTCETCGRSFKLKGSLKVHVLIHTKNVEKKYVCAQCNKSFHYNKDLEKHILRHLGVKTHNCQICNKGFIGSSALKRHIQTHTGEKPYKCDLCYKEFRQKLSLQAHLKIHNKTV